MLVSLTPQLDDAGYQKSHLLISSVARVHSMRHNLCHPTSYFPAVSFHLKPALLLTSSSHQIDRKQKKGTQESVVIHERRFSICFLRPLLCLTSFGSGRFETIFTLECSRDKQSIVQCYENGTASFFSLICLANKSSSSDDV